MNVDYLFAGADVSGRAQLLRKSTGEKRPLERVLATAVTAVTISIAAFVAHPGLSRLGHAVGTAATRLDVSDALLERVWKARSEGLQPNDKARRRASALLGAIRDSGMEPDRVVADPDGGVALYVFGRRQIENGTHARYARVLAANEGELIALCVDHERNTHDAWEAGLGDLDATVQKIQTFVAG